MLVARPTVISSIMGRFEPSYVRQLHDAGFAWFATLDDALAAQEAGADAVVEQGMEAGGHRGTFDPAAADRTDPVRDGMARTRRAAPRALPGPAGVRRRMEIEPVAAGQDRPRQPLGRAERAALGTRDPAGEVVERMWREASALLA